MGFGKIGHVHERENYSLMAIVGDLGGVFELLCSLAGIFLLPISEHSFMVNVLRKTYNIEQIAEKVEEDDSESDDQAKKQWKSAVHKILTLE